MRIPRADRFIRASFPSPRTIRWDRAIVQQGSACMQDGEQHTNGGKYEIFGSIFDQSL